MQESDPRDFPGGPVVKIPHTRRRGQGADSWSGNQDPAWCGQKLKQNNKASLKKTGARPSIISRGTNPSWVSPLTPSSVQFSSVAQSCLTLCNPTGYSMPGLPVHHQLPELTQTHVHRVSDAIQPSHPLSSPSPPAFNLSQHQSLF